MIILYTIILLISAALPLSAAVRCRTGVYSGLAEDGAVSFRGIRYALPPLGERRFAPPEPVPASNASFEAVRFGDASPQPAPTPNRQSEDCLWLNVCADMCPGRKDRPVMAF
ncbi:MAG: carboxylesterase family protein, partial [Abditibacteriota bacterium]|nr:carboxylesterase family protein [Abditibacteriota bacterium]